MKSNSSTFKPALMLMSGRTLAFMVTFLVPVVLVRLFSPAEIGTYKQFFLIVYMLYGIGQMGMAESLFFFLPSAPQNAGRYVCNSMLTLMVIGAAVVLAAVMFGEQIGGWLSDPTMAKYLAYAGVFLLLMLLGCVLEIVLISRKRYEWASFTYAFSDVLRAALLIAPALIFRTIEAVILGGLVFCLARVAALIIYARREFRSELRPDLSLLKQQLKYALPFALAVVVEVLQANYHQLAVALYFDTATFAIYAVGCLSIPLVDFMASPVCNVMMVRMGEEIREGRKQSLLPLWHDTTRKLALVFFPLVGMLIVNASFLIVVLFTETYAASIPVFLVWSLGILFAAFQTDGVLRVFAQTRFLFIMNGVRLIAIMLVMHWFLVHFGLIGAVTVTLLGVCIAKAMALLQMKRLFETKITRLLPWRNLGGIFIAATIAGIPSALLTAQIQMPPIVQLTLGGLVYAMTYVFIVWAFRLLTESERSVIVGWVMRYAGRSVAAERR